MSYKVTAPLVIVGPSEKSDEDGANNGPRYFYAEAVIPDGFNDERCKELADEGMLEKLDSAEEKAAKADAKAAEKTAEQIAEQNAAAAAEVRKQEAAAAKKAASAGRA